MGAIAGLESKSICHTWLPGQKPSEIVRFSGQALTEGVQEHKIEGVTVRTTSPAKTIVFCADQEHASEMRPALNNLNAASGEPQLTQLDVPPISQHGNVNEIMGKFGRPGR